MEEQNKVELAPVRTYSEAIELMSNWWLEKIFGKSDQDNGDATCNAFANWASDKVKNKLTPEAIAEKIVIFSDSIREQLKDQEQNKYWGTMLHVDYDPNDILDKACKLAGISRLMLPYKTITRITERNEIIGRNGYGSEWFNM